MAADLLTKAMALADTYARRRAFHAAHPFTREQDELAAERERDYARQALESFLAEHLAGVMGGPVGAPVAGVQEVGMNGLTEAETNATASVTGIGGVNASDPVEVARRLGNWNGVTVEMNDVGLREFARALGVAVGAPTEQHAYDMGAKGAPATERERLLFEAWMRGHCWALSATWDGKQYRSEAEQGGDLDPRAMATRRLFAAWRDRAALGVPVCLTPGLDVSAAAAAASEVVAAWRTSPLRSHDGRLFDAVAALAQAHGLELAAGVRAVAPVRCADCDQPNGCPEFCWCGPDGAGKAEYASWFPIRTRGVPVGLDDDALDALAMQCCGELCGDVLHMNRAQRIAFARAVLAADGVLASEPVAWVNSDELDNMLDDRTATIAGVRDGWRKTPLYRAPAAGVDLPAGGRDACHE